MAELLDYNPLTGERITMQYNHENDSLTIKHEQDCTQIIEYNKRLVLEADHTQQVKNDWIRYAKVPHVVIEKWRRELGVDFMTKDPDEWRKVMMLINSGDYCNLKTTTLYHDR